MTSTSRHLDVPRVGVAAVIRNREGKIVCGLRKGSHGTGTWQLPGGHLEMGESFATCAERETKEECGLDVRGTGVAAVTNDVFPTEGKHYITIFVKCDMLDEEAQPEILEADKCEGWFWKTWEELRAEKNLFLPLVSLFEENPDVAALMRPSPTFVSLSRPSLLTSTIIIDIIILVSLRSTSFRPFVPRQAAIHTHYHHFTLHSSGFQAPNHRLFIHPASQLPSFPAPAIAMDRLSNPKAEQVAAFGKSQRTSSRLNQVVPSQSQDTTLPTGNEAANLDHQEDPLRLDNAFENPRQAPPPPTQQSSQQQPQGPPPRSPGSNTSSAGTLDPARPPADPPVDPNGPPPPEDPTRPPSWGSQVAKAFKQSFRVVFCMANHPSEGSAPIELQQQPQAQPVEEVPADREPPQTLRQKMRGFFKFGKKASQGNEAQGGQVQGGQVQGRKGKKAKKSKQGAEVSVVPVGGCPNCSGTGVPSGPGNA